MKDEKFLQRFFIVCFVISLIPLLILGFYNHPTMDDFNCGILTRHAWLENEGLAKIPAVLAAAVQRAKNVWSSWQGTYTFSFIAALRPSIIDEDLSFINAFVLLGVFIAGFCYFGRVILYRILGISSAVSNVVIIALMTICIQYVPFGVEAFYWWNGSVGYTGFFSAMLALFGLMADSLHKRHISKKRMVGIIILEVLIAGGMYPMALLTAVMLALMLLDSLVSRAYKAVMKIQTAVMCAVYAPAFALSIVAPGNARRQALFNKTPFLKAIYYSYIDGLEFMWEEGMNAVIVIAVILLFVYMLFKLKGTTFAFRCPLMFTAVTYSMVAVLWMPTIYAIGYVSGGRYYNVLFWGTVMFWAANAIYYAGWLRRIYDRCGEDVHAVLRQFYPALVGIAGMGCLIYGMLFIDIDEDLQDMNTLSAFKSLVYGEAAAYDAEMDAREELYNDPDITVVAVEPLTYYPELLYWGTLTTDPDDSRNQAMSSYYDKEYMYEIDPDAEEEEDEDESGDSDASEE